MRRAGWIAVSSLVLALLVLGLSWRPLAATVCVNTAAYHLAQATVAGQGEPQLAQAERWSLQALLLRQDDARAKRQLVRIARARRESPEDIGVPLSVLLSQGDPLTLFHLGHIHWQGGEPERAITVWRQVPDSERFFMNQGMVDFKAGEIEAGLAAYKLSAAIDDRLCFRKKWMYADLCQYYSSQRELDEAICWCERTVAVEPSVWNLVYLGRAYLWSGGNDQALVVLERARQVNARVPSVYYYLGQTYERLSDLTLARQAYDEGLRLAPSAVNLNWEAGELYCRLGELDKAYCCYQQVVRHSTSPEQISAARKRLAALEEQNPPPLCTETP